MLSRISDGSSSAGQSKFNAQSRSHKIPSEFRLARGTGREVDVMVRQDKNRLVDGGGEESRFLF